MRRLLRRSDYRAVAGRHSGCKRLHQKMKRIIVWADYQDRSVRFPADSASPRLHINRGGNIFFSGPFLQIPQRLGYTCKDKSDLCHIRFRPVFSQIQFQRLFQLLLIAPDRPPQMLQCFFPKRDIFCNTFAEKLLLSFQNFFNIRALTAVHGESISLLKSYVHYIMLFHDYHLFSIFSKKISFYA